MLTIIDRGADLLHASGHVSDEMAGALKAEARRHVGTGSFFGHISYASLTACKRGSP
jgi:hypothetical protein